MNLSDILDQDAERKFLTRQQRTAILKAAAETSRLQSRVSRYAEAEKRAHNPSPREG